MLDRIREARKNQSGFTLIELLIVIVILGVLSGIVVFAVSGIQDRGVAASCKSDRATVEVAVEAYYAKYDGYPASLALLTAAPDKFLRSVPSNTNGYTITYVPATGGVTGDFAGCNG
jgi:prepilin-type N-terminal cleavage/methylation domain-containing protein